MASNSCVHIYIYASIYVTFEFKIYTYPFFSVTLICLLVTVSARDTSSGVLSLLSSFLHPSLSLSLSSIAKSCNLLKVSSVKLKTGNFTHRLLVSI